MNDKFTNDQNEVFGKLFGALKKQKPVVEAQAHTVINMDDENFTILYLGHNTTIVGTDAEMETIEARAKYLGIKPF